MKNLRKIFSVALILTLVLSITNLSSVFATSAPLGEGLEATTGSLTIIKYQLDDPNHTGSNQPLNGVGFTIYKVADDETSTTVPSNAAAAKPEGITGSGSFAAGTVTFTGLPIGRYLVVETTVPEAVTSTIANFLVDIPQTDSAGQNITYDVTVQPKNNTAYGQIVINKTKTYLRTPTTTAFEGVKFALQKYNGSTWVNYRAQGSSVDTTGTTNSNGQITIDNLPIGQYRLIEVDDSTNQVNVSGAGYVLDNKTTYPFTVQLGNGTAGNENKTYVVVNGIATQNSNSITVDNPRPGIAKEITAIARNTIDTNGVNTVKTVASKDIDIGDIVTYAITTDVPEDIAIMDTYVITEVVPVGLTIDQSSISCSIGATTLVKDTDYTVTVTRGGTIIAEFDPTKLASSTEPYAPLASTVVLTYNATLNRNADATPAGNTTSATLTYSNRVNVNYAGTAQSDENRQTTTDPVTATVWTGGLQIEKREVTSTGALLNGAVFKIADSVAHANAGTYLKDETGTEITLTTANDGTTDGVVTYKGLSYGTYYLVEVQAPTYLDGGETKTYNLLNKPITITIDADSFTEAEDVNVVINRRKTVLPNTGSIGAVAVLTVGITLLVLGIKQSKKNKENA